MKKLIGWVGKLHYWEKSKLKKLADCICHMVRGSIKTILMLLIFLAV